jgi:hypothetical protein
VGVHSKFSSIEERFLSHVKTDEKGCMLWTGSKTANGYGQFNPGNPLRSPKVAHKWYYEFKRGPVPKGLQLDHLCRIRHCVNLDHLEPVTQKENILRGEGASAQHARQTHCKRGHLLDVKNTYLTKNGHRKCRMCANLDIKRNRELAHLGEYKTNSAIKGGNHPRSKLDLSQIERIREMYATGKYTQTQLGEIFGCSNRHISGIVRFESWL